MDIVVLIGIPASGKTSFYKERFFPSHVYVSLDQVKTRSAERELFGFCLNRRKSCVVDNCNVTLEDRRRYIDAATAADAKVIGYCFVTDRNEALARNAAREGKNRVKDAAIRSAYSKLRYPTLAEGFDELYFVRLKNGEFEVEAYHEEDGTR